MQTFAEALERLGGRERRKLQNNTYLEARKDGSGEVEAVAVRLHATDVLTFRRDGRVVYDSGGWLTVTTKDRMNAHGPLRVWSDRGVWYVSSNGYETRTPYADGLTLGRRGGITGAAKVARVVAERQKAIRYCRDYMDALEAGKVPAPGAGDCWYCGMREVKSGAPLGEMRQDRHRDKASHVRDHIRERYYVPSLLQRALEVGGAAKVQWWWLGSFWAPTEGEGAPTPELRESARGWNERARCEGMLRRYVLRELGQAGTRTVRSRS